MIKKPTMVPTKRRSIPRPSCSGLLKSSTTASNIPKSSASGLTKGGAGTRTKGLSKLPRTNTRTGILRAQVSCALVKGLVIILRYFTDELVKCLVTLSLGQYGAKSQMKG